MTREEALQQFENVAFDCNRKDNEKLLLLDNAKIIINKIYDDFENRICKNCKYSNSFLCDRVFCSKFNTLVDRDFGCNKFELDN